MIRHEGEKILVRYDGTETRVFVNRGSETNGLSVDELEELIWTLEDALGERLKFIKQGVSIRKKKRALRSPKEPRLARS